MTFLRFARIAIASAALSACAPSLKHESPLDLYRALVGTGGPGCVPTDEEDKARAERRRYEQRIEALRPWLEHRVGPAEIDRVHEEYNEMLGGVSFIGCPSANYEAWQSMTARRILREMERRRRREARITPLSAGRPSDRAH